MKFIGILIAIFLRIVGEVIRLGMLLLFLIPAILGGFYLYLAVHKHQYGHLFNAAFFLVLGLGGVVGIGATYFSRFNGSGERWSADGGFSGGSDSDCGGSDCGGGDGGGD